MAGQIVELSSLFRERAARLRRKAQVVGFASAQSLLLLAEEYDRRAQRLERRRASQREAERSEKPVEAAPAVS